MIRRLLLWLVSREPQWSVEPPAVQYRRCAGCGASFRRAPGAVAAESPLCSVCRGEQPISERQYEQKLSQQAREERRALRRKRQQDGDGHRVLPMPAAGRGR